MKENLSWISKARIRLQDSNKHIWKGGKGCIESKLSPCRKGYNLSHSQSFPTKGTM